MAVYELKAGVPPGSIDRLEELLGELEEQRLMVLEDKPSGRTWLAGYFESHDEAIAAWKRLVGAMPGGLMTIEPAVSELADVDWKNSYKAHFKASKFGRLNWVPVWERDTFVPATGEEVLWLDPGMAFGTGNHETTRLCCKRLTDFVARRGTAGRVIDAGCGSGILALSAAKLGFQHIIGFDNDPEAIRVSEENSAANGLVNRVKFQVGDIVTGLSERQAELVLANIQADVLMRFAHELLGAVAPGGELVLSGILSGELATVREEFLRVATSRRTDSRTLGEWADLRVVG